jgi:WD40 repeat protein
VSGTAVANFSGHACRLYCGLWSPVDSDVVFTGGDDSTVFGWKISEQTNKTPTKKLPKKIVQVICLILFIKFIVCY